MSDTASTPRPRPARRKGPSPITVVTGTLGLFLVTLTLLAFQVRAGKDPSLSRAAPVTSTSNGTAPATGAATKSVATKTS